MNGAHQSQGEGALCPIGRRADAVNPAGFAKHIAEEAEKWAKVIKAQGIAVK